MFNWRRYVPQSSRRASAARFRLALKKRGVAVSPVVIEGRLIARSFWGKAWCENLESYSDYSNRLPRGRTYARNGSVVHLTIAPGVVSATVAGSELYETQVRVGALARKQWKQLVASHASQVSSLVDLLQGRLPQSLLTALADRNSGLFPQPREMQFDCSCPDWASTCKHVAAVLYGVGARLDTQPELFFALSGVEVSDLATSANRPDFGAASGVGELAGQDLSALFGIEMAADESPRPKAARSLSKPTRRGKVATAKVTKPARKAVAKARKVLPQTSGRAVPKAGSAAKAGKKAAGPVQAARKRPAARRKP